MTDLTDLTPPSKNGWDDAYTLLRGLVGGFAGELLGLIIIPGYQERIDRWMEDMSDIVSELLRKDTVDIEALSKDPRFTSIFIQCTQTAMRHHQEDKLKLLRNVVRNAAQHHQVDEDLESIFIRYIDELTPTHFSLLSFLSKNETRLANIGSYDDLLGEFKSRTNVEIERVHFRLLCRDLEARLLAEFSENIRGLENTLKKKSWDMEGDNDKPMLVTTDLGSRLLLFVSDNS